LLSAALAETGTDTSMAANNTADTNFFFNANASPLCLMYISIYTVYTCKLPMSNRHRAVVIRMG
ncbi:MAG: hypothetical protein K0R28_2255, partial [Paenibacillus sp.]|nr:hypothetical protein [Paenibacillus sp.]